jgi:hypothetical protein
MRSRLATWAAVVVPIWIVMILCTHWEPVQRDGWGHLIWQRHTGLTFTSLIDFARGTYVHNNTLFTPVLELATFYLVVALVLGRWPRSADDALIFLATFAITAISAPQFGEMLFYRPYTGNYVFGFCVNLAFLVPYRFGRAGWWIVPLGFASGMCNEHTGPAVVALAALATWATWKTSSGAGKLAKLAGVAAMIAGGLVLYFAPGQNIRYNGIAQTSLAERFAERGVGGNVEVLAMWFVYLAPALVWISIAVAGWWRKREPIAQDERRVDGALIAAAFAIVITLLLSPKLGPRLYFASCTLVAAVIARHAIRYARMPATILSVLVAGFVAVVCVSDYHAAGVQWAARVATWQRTPEVVDPPPQPGARSRWILDDDMQQPEYRALAAKAFAIMPGP